MSVWRQLGLEPTGDLKAIKKAYAVLLKQNKPDENPQGFAALHKAYKTCIAQAKQMADTARASESPAQAVEESETSVSTSAVSRAKFTHQAEPEPTSVKPDSVSPPCKPDLVIDTPFADDNPLPAPATPTAVIHAPYEEALLPSIDFEREQQSLIAQTQQALQIMQREDNPAAWSFIADSDALYDISFKHGYSHYLIEQILEFFKQNKIPPALRRRCLHSLDNQFDWLGQARDLEEHWGYNALESVLDVLQLQEGVEERKLKWVVDKHHRGPLQQANYYARLAATGIDLLVFYLLTGAILPQLTTAEMLLTLPLIFLAIKAALESSPVQGSPGQVVFGLKVTSTKGRRLNIVHALWRQLMYGITMAGFKVTVWINVFLNGRLLHDRLSGSIVVKR